MNHPITSVARRTAAVLSLVIALLAGLLAVAAPAGAAAADRLTVLSDWTRTSTASYTSWNTARLDRETWATYNFDWSTDHCSTSPDQPLGFDFRLACHRHDFGYRNYKAANRFADNKARLDNAFYADLKRKCGTYSVFVQGACYSLAWTYYTAVQVFGSLIGVTTEDLDRAARIKAAGMQAANR